MKALLTGLYRLLRKACHPVLWGALFVALYGNLHYRDRLYWETPSIPFRPFCVQEGNWEPHRPIEGITMSREFEEEVVKAMSERRVTMKVVYRIHDEFGDHPNPGPHIYVAPIDYYDPNMMLWVSRSAVQARQAYLSKIAPDSSLTVKTPDLYCKDVEGVVTEL